MSGAFDTVHVTKIGVARVSTREQHPEAQHDALTVAGYEKIITDNASGKLARRRELDKALLAAHEGDQIVVTKLDRLGRSLENLIELSKRLQAKKGDFVVIDLGIDTSTGLGRMFFHTLDSVAEFEAALASERTIDGLAAARARGRTGGRNPSSDRAKSPSPGRCMTRPVPMAAVAIPSSRSLPEFGVTRPTIYRHLGKTTDTAASWPAKTGHQ